MIKIIPFLKKRYETDLGASKILDRIRQKVIPPDWNVSLAKMTDYKTLEGEVVGNEFFLSTEKFGLTYGKANFLPLLKGTVLADRPNNRTLIKVVIRPSLLVIVIYVILVFLMGSLFRYELRKSDFGVSAICLFFILLPYVSMVIRFNRAVGIYLRFIEEDILDRF